MGVPILNRPDLLERMLASVDVPVDRLVIVDNGGVVGDVDAHVLRMPENLGVATSWNFIIKATASAPWWLIVNNDVEFGPGDLARLALVMADPSPKVCTLKPNGFAAFGINRACIETVGYFDEGFHPAYCEDADYEYRCRLAGVPLLALPSGTTHVGSATIKEPFYSEQNARTYPENYRYFERKWGGTLRGGETFTRPFDGPGTVADWRGDHRRRVELAWTPR